MPSRPSASCRSLNIGAYALANTGGVPEHRTVTRTCGRPRLADQADIGVAAMHVDFEGWDNTRQEPLVGSIANTMTQLTHALGNGGPVPTVDVLPVFTTRLNLLSRP